MFFRKKPNFTEDNLNSVITACLANDQHAQRTLIKLFFGFTKSVSWRYAINELEAEEIVNDGFLKVFNNLAKYDHTQPFKAWLRTIIVNTAIDYYRKNQKYACQVDIDDMEIIDLKEDIISKISSFYLQELKKNGTGLPCKPRPL